MREKRIKKHLKDMEELDRTNYEEFQKLYFKDNPITENWYSKEYEQENNNG